ncbi:hypothetical protein BDZ89DRAFT_1070652 [Hymenopellis radicata]|nr:hypothetical protein BDZ89DRAFT_1070652 [Hymenopellis radicata]
MESSESIPVIPLASSSNGRVSSKSWKPLKSATVPQIEKLGGQDGKDKKALSIKKLEVELKEEKKQEVMRRKEVTMERKKAAEERQRLEEDKAKMGARKAARLRRKAGRSKKVNG